MPSGAALHVEGGQHVDAKTGDRRGDHAARKQQKQRLAEVGEITRIDVGGAPQFQAVVREVLGQGGRFYPAAVLFSRELRMP